MNKVHQLSIDISNWLQPPRWHLFSWLRWRTTQQPRHVLAKMEQTMTGAHPARVSLGIVESWRFQPDEEDE